MASISIAPEDKVFVLTGAGISAESGLPTFRASDGLWPAAAWRMCYPRGLDANRWRVWESTRLGARRARKPSRIRRTFLGGTGTPPLGSRYFLCTQNVDDLHERAGSAAVHMHGNWPRRAAKSNADGLRSMSSLYRRPCRGGSLPCGGLLRPHIVSSARFRWRWSASRRNRQGHPDGRRGHLGSVYPPPTLSIGAMNGARTSTLARERP